MNPNLKWKIIFILAVVLICLYSIFCYPTFPTAFAQLKSNFANQIKLGLDLQGGTHMILQVQVQEAVAQETDQTVDRITSQLRAKNIRYEEVRRVDNDKGRFTLVFLCAPEDEGLFKAAPQNRGAPLVELTYNWDEEKYGEDRHFGHLAYEVDDIYATCDRLMKAGITINRPPRDGNMAFVRSPDLHSIELLQKGDPKPPAEPWSSMPNTGHW
jgi:lactoylglutathione lyase